MGDFEGVASLTASPLNGDTSAGRGASELFLLASYLRLVLQSTVPFVGSITTVVLFIANPFLRDATLVGTREFVVLAFRRFA